MKRVCFIAIVLFTFTFTACQSDKGSPASKELAQEAAKPGCVIVLGIDESGSFMFWEQARKIAVQIIEQLEPGDVFYCRRITDASYLDSCMIFKLEIPAIEQPKSSNPFDRKQKNIYRSQIQQINLIKRDASNRLAALKFTNSNHTDIYGCLAAATDRFALASKDTRKILIIASDLLDNVGYEAKIDLSGASVGILAFQASRDPKKSQRLKNQWTKRLTEAGAARVVVLSVEEKFSMKFFLGA